jgi:hypothetical protein
MGEWGETVPNAVLYDGGDRPMGETAPNAVLYGGYRKGYRWLLRGYCGGTRPQRGL